MKKSMSTLLAGLMVIMTIAAGCDDPFNASSDPVGSPSGSRSLISGVGINPTRDTVGCVTAIGILEQDSYLTLYTLNSEVKYDRGSVLIPTPVSFSICDLDTTGTTFISRAMAFGENSSVIFLRPLKVKVAPVDVGLPENISDGTKYSLYRKNDNTGGWDLVLLSRIEGSKLQYEIFQNGVYAVSLDLTWIGCATAIGMLAPNSNLTLSTLNSEVKYESGSVLVPTPVSFSICDFDTTGTTFISRAMAFGENSSVVFLRPLTVKVDPVDVGLPENIPNGTTYFLYRKNDNTGGWDLALPSKIKNHKLEYEILLNGVYAVSLDTTWISSGLIGTGGGTVSVRTATISFPPGALTDTATISFRLSVSTPVDLPAALDRVYEFGPEGLVFQTPVTLYVPFVEAGITDGKVHPWRLYYHDESSNSWVPQPTSFDWANQRIVVRLSHFSRYAFAR